MIKQGVEGGEGSGSRGVRQKEGEKKIPVKGNEIRQGGKIL